MKPIDLFITCYLRQAYTEQTLRYLEERTSYPYRLFIIHQGGNDEVLDAYKDKIFLRVDLKPNAGIHAAWNVALSLVESGYFITSDNDIYVPQLSPDWLSQMIRFMDASDYAAISLHPHVLIGDVSADINDPENVKEVSHCGAVMRIMRTEAVRNVGGWERVVRTSRNHEERYICGKLRESGWKVGRTTRLRAFHPFGFNWGYPDSLKATDHGHNPDLDQYVNQFNNIEAYNNKTWLPK